MHGLASRTLLTLLFLAGLASAGPIVNGGFESGSSNWILRQGWRVDCSESRSGDCSVMYITNTSDNTPLARQHFEMAHDGTCEFSVWIRTELNDPAFWSDGEPTRTGVTVQIWNHTGEGPLVPLDLASQPVHRVGYRGQGGDRGWTKYTGRIPMEAGEWEVRLYMHALRSNVDGSIQKVSNAHGRAWVDDVQMVRVGGY